MKFRLVEISLCLCVSVVIVFAQALTTEAQRHREVAVQFPDLSTLEPGVREQIKSQQDVLVATVKDPKSTDTKLSTAYGELGETYHAYSLNAPARECYLNAGKLAPKDFRWIYLLGKLDQIEGRMDDAIQRFRTVSSLQPEFVAAQVNLGNIYLELNRLEEAQSNFNSALQKQANNPAAHYGLGQIALSKRNYAEAVEHFEKALALVPEANRIHYALGMAYRGLRNPEKTKLHLAQQGPVGVRVTDPLMDQIQDRVKGANVHLVRGKLALESKRYQEAAAELRKAIEARPDSVPAHINLGAALSQLGDLEGAAQQFQKAMTIDPNNLTAHYNLAVLWANKKRHDEAIVHLQKVVTLNPDDRGASFFLAQQLLHANRADEALKVAEALYSTTGSLQHGVLVVSALAKLKRCNDAAEWQQKLMTKAVEDGNEELQVKLKSVLCQP